MSDETGFTLEYREQGEAQKILREICGSGYSWRREHLLGEGVKVVVLIFPVFLLLAGMVNWVSVVMYVAGIYVWRGYEKYLVPALMRWVGHDRRRIKGAPATLVVDHSGVTSTGPDLSVHLSWRTVSDNSVLRRRSPASSLCAGR